MDKHAKALVKKLNDEGAAVLIPGCTTGWAVAVLWCGRGGWLYWADLIPEDQHHVHRRKAISTTVRPGDRLSIETEDGVYQFGPAADWPGVDLEKWRRTWAMWQGLLAKPEGRAEVARFLKDAIGDSPPELR